VLFKAGRSVGTTRPPQVTFIPGGLPCSLMSLSTLLRLTDGEGEGRLPLELTEFSIAVGVGAGVG
jgi:hypothetical protein